MFYETLTNLSSNLRVRITTHRHLGRHDMTPTSLIGQSTDTSFSSPPIQSFVVRPLQKTANIRGRTILVRKEGLT